MRALVVLTDTEITESLCNNGAVLQRFPFLNIVRTRRDDLGGCKPCESGPKGDALKAALKDAHRHLAMMSDSDKAELKKLLNAQNVRVFYLDAADGGIRRNRVDF